MPIILEYTAYDCFLNFVITSPRPEGVPSTIVPNAAKHQEIASTIRGHLREYKHRLENAVERPNGFVPTAWQVNTYLPPVTGAPYYGLRKLQPLGSLNEVDEDFFLDVTRIRYGLTFVMFAAGVLANEKSGMAFEQHWQKAWKDLLLARAMTDIFIPGDEGEMKNDRPEVQIMLEPGVGAAMQNFEIPTPS